MLVERILKRFAGLSPQVLEYIKYVNFTTREGAKVYFDENGEVVAQYDLVNWQMKEDGSVKIEKIGSFDTSFPGENKLRLEKGTDISWGGNSKQVHENFVQTETFDLILLRPWHQSHSLFCSYS